MKVVSTAKFARAEKELKEAKAYGSGAQGTCVYVLCVSLVEMSMYANTTQYVPGHAHV